MSSFVQSLSKGLFWDVDPETVDEVKHRRFIIQRVLERGDLDDWNNTKAHYTVPVIVDEAKQMRYLDPRVMAFVACIGNVKESDFRCYTLRQSNQQHWPF